MKRVIYFLEKIISVPLRIRPVSNGVCTNKDRSKISVSVATFLLFAIISIPIAVLATVPANFVFVSAQQSLAPNAVSEPITLQSQDSGGNSSALTQTGCIYLKSTSSTGQFSSSGTNWNPVAILTMNKGTANRNFYYKDSAEGTPTLSVQIALKPETESKSCASWPFAEWSVGWNASQNITIGSSGGSGAPAPVDSVATSTDSNQTADNPAPASGGSSWPAEPQIFSRIVGPNSAISGADIALKGETIGLDKKPIENARYLWNFGDGSTKEGEAVLHGYNFPGDYVVILDVASGKLTASSRLRVKVVAADILLGGIVGGPDGKIELINNSNQELDLSWWRIRSGNQFFTLPKNTKVLAHGRLPLANSVTGLDARVEDVTLIYPNGSLAYSPQTVAKIASSPEKVLPNVQPASVVSPSEVKVPVKQSAAVGEAVADSSNENFVPATTETVQTRSFFSSWLYGVIGVIILGLGFILLPKSIPATPIETKRVVDEYKIIED